MSRAKVKPIDLSEEESPLAPPPLLRPIPVVKRRRPVEPTGPIAPAMQKKSQTAPPSNLPLEKNLSRPRSKQIVAHEKNVREHLKTHKDDPRFQHELKEMQEVHDLDEIDDDVEDEATLLEWRAPEHTHRPKSPIWFASLAAGTTIIVGIQLYLFNFFGALTIALVGAMIYYIAQQKPEEARYRIMLDGVAINNLLYHWEDLAEFNVIYIPGECKAVIIKSDRQLAPYVHMEIDDEDPTVIRDILVEYLHENQDMHEPLSDVLARRLGF